MPRSLLRAMSLAAAPPVATVSVEHESQPGMLQLREVSPERYDVLRKLPSTGPQAEPAGPG